MPYYADCYVLIESREKRQALKLIKHFLPGDPIQSSELYEVPRWDSPVEIVFTNAYEFMEYLEQNPNVDTAIYFSSSHQNKYNHVSIHYTKDGCMILCSSIPADDESEDLRLKELKKLFGTPWGYITYETPPEYTKKEFIASVNSIKVKKDELKAHPFQTFLHKLRLLFHTK